MASKPRVATRSTFLRASLREPKAGRVPESVSPVLRICSMRVPSSSAYSSASASSRDTSGEGPRSTTNQPSTSSTSAIRPISSSVGVVAKRTPRPRSSSAHTSRSSLISAKDTRWSGESGRPSASRQACSVRWAEPVSNSIQCSRSSAILQPSASW